MTLHDSRLPMSDDQFKRFREAVWARSEASARRKAQRMLRWVVLGCLLAVFGLAVLVEWMR